MTDKRVIQILHDVLRDRTKWHIETGIFDNEELAEINEKAKEACEYGLSTISFRSLYNRYLEWKKEGIDNPCKEYFVSFIEHVMWDMAIHELRGIEKLYFEESCYLTFVINK
jgi:hypothetical protein